MTATTHRDRILIVGASRGLGLGLATAFADQDWHVTGTVRDPSARTGLHELAAAYPRQVTIETLDITVPAQITALRERLPAAGLDVLFINAGTTNATPNQAIGTVDHDEFVHVMTTNALSPMRVLEALDDRVKADGLLGVMSSGQGSIADNERGLRELYRASKAALNMSMRSYAARQPEPDRALLLLAPGWIRTDLGGDDARYTLEESIPLLRDVIQSKRGRPGLEYLDRDRSTVAW